VGNMVIHSFDIFYKNTAEAYINDVVQQLQTKPPLR